MAGGGKGGLVGILDTVIVPGTFPVAVTFIYLKEGSRAACIKGAKSPTEVTVPAFEGKVPVRVIASWLKFLVVTTVQVIPARSGKGSIKESPVTDAGVFNLFGHVRE